MQCQKIFRYQPRKCCALKSGLMKKEFVPGNLYMYSSNNSQLNHLMFHIIPLKSSSFVLAETVCLEYEVMNLL